MPSGKPLRLLCWNVNGIRAVQKKGFVAWVQKQSPDILCLQEMKAQPDQLDDALKNVDGYESYCQSAERKGYSGVAIYTKVKPLSVQLGFGNPRFDVEGRVMSAEYPAFTLFNIYFPNGGRGDERLQYKLDFYDQILTH